MELFLYPVFLAVTFVIYPVAIYALIKWYHQLRLSNRAELVWMPVTLMPTLTCILSYATIATSFIGTGVVMIVCAVPLTFINLFLHYRNGRDAQKAKNDIPTTRRWLSLLVVVLIITMNLAPIVGTLVIFEVCSNLHTMLAEPIVEALATYHADNGEYPRTLEGLVPQYLESIPSPLCNYLVPAAVFDESKVNTEYDAREYHLEWCPAQEDNAAASEYPVLTVMHISGSYPYRYDLQTGEWHSASGFTGGICGEG